METITNNDTTTTEPEVLPAPYSKIRASYDPIAAMWKEARTTRGDSVPMTMENTTKALRKIHRFLTGRPWPGYEVTLTHGRVNTWHRRGTWRVNVSGSDFRSGWSELLHACSHWYWQYDRNFDRDHSKRHARYERRLVKMVIERGWPWGTLEPKRTEKPEPTRDEIRSKKIETRRAQVSRLERKLKSLTTRLRTAKRSLRALERAASQGF